MKAKWMAVMMVVSLVFLGALASGVWACAQKMAMAQAEREELGPAASSPEYDYDIEGMAPAVPAPQQGTEEMSPASSAPQSGSEEMSPAGSGSSHEEDFNLRNAPYRAPATESQPY